MLWNKEKKGAYWAPFFRLVAGPTRLELATSGVTGRHSNQLSYTRAATWEPGPLREATGAVNSLGGRNFDRRATGRNQPASIDSGASSRRFNAWTKLAASQPSTTR